MAEGINDAQITKSAKAMKDLNKALEKANISQKQFNTLTNELKKAHRDLNLVKKTEDYTKAQSKLNYQYREMHRSLEMIKNVTTSIFVVDHITNIEDMAINMVKLNAEMYRSLTLAGKGGEAMRGYQKTLNNLSTQFGATHEDANKIIKVLATNQYVGTAKDIDLAASASYRFAEATGLSKDEVTENTVELQKWGQITAKTTEAMYADTLKVAKANGITQKGMSTILKQTQNWSGIMKAFGKSPEDVQKYNMSLSKTVSALEKVGISAQTTTSLLDKLTDPERIEENIALYAALGISIEDALSGNIDSMDMAGGLKEFGEKLKTMGPIAGAQYAKAFGVSYKDAIKATTADLDEVNQIDMTPEEKASEALTAAMESTRNLTEKINAELEKIGGRFREFGPIGMIVITTLGRVFLGMAMDTIKKISDKIKTTFSKDGKEAADGLTNSMDTAANDIGESLRKNSVDGIMAGVAAMEDASKEELRILTETNKQAAEEYKQMLYDAVNAVNKGNNLDINNTVGESADLAFIDKEITENEKLKDIKKSIYDMSTEYQNNINELSKIEKDLKKKGDDETKEILNLRKDQLNEMVANEKTAIQELKKAADTQNDTIKDLVKAKEVLKTKLTDETKKVVDSTGFKIGKAIGTAVRPSVWGKQLGDAVKNKIQSGASKIGKGIGSASKNIMQKIKFKKLKIDEKAGKSIGEKFKETVKNVKIGLKTAGGGAKGGGNKQMIGAMGKLGGALGGLTKIAGKLGMAMLVINIVMKIIGKALENLGEPLQNIIDNLVNILAPVFEAVLKPILPLVQTLVKALLPPVLKVLGLMLKVLNILLKPLNMLLKLLGHIPGLDFLKDVAEGLDEATGPNVTNALNDAANKIKDSNTDLTKKTEENTEAVEGKTKGESLSFNGGKVTVKSATYSSNNGGNDNSSSSSNSSNSNSSTVKNNDNQSMTITALGELKESMNNMANKLVVYMKKMEDAFDKMISSGDSKVYQERAAIEQAFGLDDRKIVNVNIADAAGVISGARNVIGNIFGKGGNDNGGENHEFPKQE